RTQRHNAPGLPPAEHAHHAVATDFGAHFDTQRPEMIGDELRGSHFVRAQLRMLMDVLAPRYDLGVHALHRSRDLGMESGEPCATARALRSAGCDDDDQEQWEEKQATH